MKKTELKFKTLPAYITPEEEKLIDEIIEIERDQPTGRIRVGDAVKNIILKHGRKVAK
jgi:hypothetical protein